jgi:glutamate receptor, ionotropic, invertebrate
MKFNTDVMLAKVQKNQTVETKSIGKWTAGLNNELEIFAIDEMKSLKARDLYRIATVVRPPFIIRDENAPRGFVGYCIEMIDRIAEIVDFDYEIYEVERDGFGWMNDQGEWNGVVRKLVDKEADIGLGTMTVMAERESFIDFTIPYYDMVGISVLMLRNKEKTTLFKFLTVLETDVWLCILGAYILTRFSKNFFIFIFAERQFLFFVAF